MAPNSPACSFIHASIVGSRSTAPLNRSIFVPIVTLFGRARAGDKDVHQSFGTLLPVRAGCHMRDADERPKKVEWVEIFAHFTALYGALDEQVKRSRDPTARTFKQFRGASGQR